jgi:hypothetical protein
MRRFDAGITVCQLGIRLFDHRTPGASPFPALYDGSGALNVLLFQYGDMASQYYRVVNCGRRMVGWSCAQYTKYVPYPHSLHDINLMSLSCSKI